MKSKSTTIVLGLIIAMSIFSCSKKNSLSQSDTEKYKKLSQQMEMNRESQTLSASADEKTIELSTIDTRFETALAKANLTEVQKKKVEKIVTKIANSKIYQKMVAKNVEKSTLSENNSIAEKSSITGKNSPEKVNAITGNLRTGIIIAAIGLIFLLVGALLWGSWIVGSIFYVIGAILLIVGLIMILLALI